MAGSMSNFLELEILDHIFGNATAGNPYVPPATLYVGLGTAVAGTSQEAGFTGEVTGGAYARVGVANTAANWPAAANGSKSNGVAVTFPQATASWGTVTQFALFDAATAGNLLAWGDLTVSKAIGANDTASFAVGSLVFTLD